MPSLDDLNAAQRALDAQKAELALPALRALEKAFADPALRKLEIDMDEGVKNLPQMPIKSVVGAAVGTIDRTRKAIALAIKDQEARIRKGSES